MNRVLKGIFGLSVSIFIALFGVQMVGAVDQLGELRLVSRGELFNAAPTSIYSCAGDVRDISVDGKGLNQKSCVFGISGGVRIARYVFNNSYQFGVSFAGRDVFYELRGVCDRPGCVYSQASDTLLSHRSIGFGRQGVAVIRNLSERLERKLDLLTYRHYYEVTIDESIDAPLKSNGMNLQVDSFALSKNGKWAVVEARGFGFLRLNIPTNELRRIIAPGATYGVMNDPYYELAITNDGRYVATTGYRSSTSLYEIDNTCGDTVTSSSDNYFSSGVSQCRFIHVPMTNHFPDIYHGFAPSFSDEVNHFELSVLNRSSTVERAVYSLSQPSTASVNPIKYLALGDSFTSGEGEFDDGFYRTGSNLPGLKCHVSIRSYPFLVADAWSKPGQSVACSGAKTVDVLGKAGYMGQWGVLKGLDTPHVDDRTQAALRTFQSGIVPQIYFASKYQPEVISIGIGGNDIGLVGKLSACLMPNECEWATDPAKKYASAKEIASVYPKIRDLLRRIKASAPNARMVVVGYPSVIDGSVHASCDPLINTLLSQNERRFIDESIQYLNAVIRSAAHAEGVQYLAEGDSFRSHTLCGSRDSVAMNSVRFGDDVAPLKFMNDFKVFGAESFHPTPKGHEITANTFIAQYPSMAQVQSCEECKSQGQLPIAPGYWGELDDGEYSLQFEDATITDSVYSLGDAFKVSTNDLLFMPNTDVIAELRSSPIQLFEGQSNVRGAVHFELSSLKGVTPGYHTLHLYGTGMGGEPVDVYKVIAVQRKGLESAAQDALPIDKANSSTRISHFVNPLLFKDSSGNLPAASGVSSSVLGDSDVVQKSVSGRFDAPVLKPALAESNTFSHKIILGIVIYFFTTLVFIGLFYKYRSQDRGG